MDDNGNNDSVELSPSVLAAIKEAVKEALKETMGEDDVSPRSYRVTRRIGVVVDRSADHGLMSVDWGKGNLSEFENDETIPLAALVTIDGDGKLVPVR